MSVVVIHIQLSQQPTTERNTKGESRKKVRVGDWIPLNIVAISILSYLVLITH